MRRQQPGISPYPGHHPSSKEMQMWQQHLLYKQMQELQRQQQQLNQGARQQNLLSQAAARQTLANQLPGLLNGMPINDASSYMLPNDIIGGESRTPNNSQMFISDNTNWAQGRGSLATHGSNILTNDHGQAMRSAGLIPQQPDHSLYGTPISVSRGLLNQYPQFQGMPNNFNNVMVKEVRNQFENTSLHSVPSNSFQNETQGCQEKSLFANSPVQSLSGGATSGNFQKVNHPQHINQAGWSTNLEEKTTRIGTSRGATCLDPEEEKILFGTDDNGNLGSSFGSISNMGMGGYLRRDPFEGNDQIGDFPSLQSGSWSALMQEAVQASSSEDGFREAWSGLSLQNTTPSVVNTSTMHDDVAKHQATWENDTSNLKPSPLLNDANSVPSFPMAPRFLHSTTTAYEENNIVQSNASHKSFQLSSMDEQTMHFDQSSTRKLFLQSGLQAQIQPSDVPHDVWPNHTYGQSIKSADFESMDLQNNQATWSHQEQLPLSNINRQLDTNNRTLFPQKSENMARAIEPVNSDIGSSQIKPGAFATSNLAAIMNSNSLNANQEMNQHAVNRFLVDPGTRDALDSYAKSRGENMEEYKHQPIKVQQLQNLSANSPSPSVSDSHTSSGMSGWKNVGSRKRQSHTIENLGNAESADSPKDTAYSHSLPKSIIQQSKIQEQGYTENSQFPSHGILNMGKGHSTDMQRSIKSPAESQYRSTMPIQTSGNMLELLHKVDNSKDNSTCFGSSDLNTVRGSHESGAAGGSVPYPHQSSSSQSFGLRLASPSQRQQVSNQDLQSQASLVDSNRTQLVSGVEDKDKVANLSYMGRQLQPRKQKQLLQQQHISTLAGCGAVNQYGNPTSGSHSDVEERMKQAFLLRQAQISHNMTMATQSAQKSLPTMSGRNLPRKFPFLETQPAVQTSDRSDVSGQIGLPTTLHNVWRNASLQVAPNIPQPIVLSGSGRDKSSGDVHMEDDQGNKEASAPPELGTGSHNSDQVTDANKNPMEEDSVHGTDSERGDDRGQEQDLKHLSDRNSAVSVSSNCDVGHYGGHTVAPSHFQQRSYSLLQQMQAMKGADTDASSGDGKRLKGELGQGYIYGQSAVSKVPLADELGVSSNSSFPSDAEMLSFSQGENGERSAERIAQPDVQNQTQPLTSTPHIIRRNEHPMLTFHMARSWFEQYRRYKNGQILAMQGDHRSSESLAKIDNKILAEQSIKPNQYGDMGRNMSASSSVADESSSQLQLGTAGQEMVVRSKKRKTATSELLPWHLVVSLGVQRLQSISMAECGWAQATNRLTEKVEDTAEMIEDGSFMPQARKRLILTTQLMQRLLPPVPAQILDVKVASGYESVTYFLAKSSLGDACSLISCPGSDSGAFLVDENRMSEKWKTSAKANEVIFSEVVVDFTERSRKLENVFSRLDTRTSILDVRLEWQEVERFSLINRLGKFHARHQTDGAESSSTSQNAPRRIYPQKYVTAFSIPRNVPEGVHCLSL